MAARPFEQFEFEKVFNGKCVSFRNLTHSGQFERISRSERTTLHIFSSSGSSELLDLT